MTMAARLVVTPAAEKKITTSLILELLLFYIFSVNQGIVCLRLQKVVVPTYKLKGDNGKLECLYELDGDTLYAVKWYKDNEEFYRYVPKSSPPQSSYKVEGIKVDHNISNSRQVILKAVNLRTSGVYRCEVSAEAPSFSSAQNEGRMEVVMIPRDGPHISGEKKEYQIGDEITLNCSSGKSFPASELRWFINDNQVPQSALQKYPKQTYAHGVVTTQVGLRMTLSSDHFIDGSLRVRCVATLSALPWQGNSESVLQKIDNREAMLLVRGSATSNRYCGTLILQTIIIVCELYRHF